MGLMRWSHSHIRRRLGADEDEVALQHSSVTVRVIDDMTK